MTDNSVFCLVVFEEQLDCWQEHHVVLNLAIPDKLFANFACFFRKSLSAVRKVENGFGYPKWLLYLCRFSIQMWLDISTIYDFYGASIVTDSSFFTWIYTGWYATVLVYILLFFHASFFALSQLFRLVCFELRVIFNWTSLIGCFQSSYFVYWNFQLPNLIYTEQKCNISLSVTSKFFSLWPLLSTKHMVFNWVGLRFCRHFLGLAEESLVPILHLKVV